MRQGTEVLTENEWQSLKQAYTDFQADVAASFGTVYVRAILVGHLAEGTPEGPLREGARSLRGAVRYAAQDIEDRFAAFERRLNEFRAPVGIG